LRHESGLHFGAFVRFDINISSVIPERPKAERGIHIHHQRLWIPALAAIRLGRNDGAYIQRGYQIRQAEKAAYSAAWRL
jgi:hypothetical protein